MIWFTSDTHFGHANALNFTDRPHADIAHMNHALINAINERMAPIDDLYLLGDFSFKTTTVCPTSPSSKILPANFPISTAEKTSAHASCCKNLFV